MISFDLPGVAGHALCLQVSSVYQSVGPGHTSSVVLFLWAGHVAFGGLSPTGQRVFLFALLPGSIPLIHSTHMESNVEQSNLCQHANFFIFQNRSYKAPVHGSNSLAGCFQCFSFFHCSCLISLQHIVSYYWSIACFHFFHVCSFFFILLHYFSFCCMFFHFVAFISVYFILFHFFSFLFRTKTQLV